MVWPRVVEMLEQVGRVFHVVVVLEHILADLALDLLTQPAQLSPCPQPRTLTPWPQALELSAPPLSFQILQLGPEPSQWARSLIRLGLGLEWITLRDP